MGTGGSRELMSLVYKYKITHNYSRSVPGGKIVLAGKQGDEYFVWVLRDLSQDRAIRIYATGETIQEGWEHVYSFQDGLYVWHVFESVLT